MARLALRVIVADIIVSVGMGLFIVVAWEFQPGSDFLNNLASGPGGGQGIPAAGFLIALFLSVPSLGAGLLALVRGQWLEVSRLLSFAGPFAVFVSFLFLAHDLDLCRGAWDETSRWGTLQLCEGSGDSLTIHGRFHLLYHALVPTALVVALYWLAARRWRPQIAYWSRSSSA